MILYALLYSILIGINVFYVAKNISNQDVGWHTFASATFAAFILIMAIANIPS